VIGPFLVKKLLLLGWFEHAAFGFPLAKSLLCLLPHHSRLSAFLPLPPPLCLVLVARLLLIPGNGALLAVLSSPQKIDAHPLSLHRAVAFSGIKTSLS